MITFAGRKDSGRHSSKAAGISPTAAAAAAAAADQQDGYGGSAKQLYSFDKAQKQSQTAEALPGRAKVRQITLPRSLMSFPPSQQPAANHSNRANQRETARHKAMHYAPSTARKTVPHQRVTPLTEPAHLQKSSSDPSDSTGDWSVPSSANDASSYRPSQENKANDGSPELRHLTVKPSLLSRLGPAKGCRDSGSRAIKQHPPITDKAEVPDTLNIAVQGSHQVYPTCEASEEGAPRAAKRQRITKGILKEAQIHMPAGTVRTSAEPDSLLFEMPPEFDVAGDAGGIGRFSVQSNTSNTKLLMDIKGTIYDAKPAYCSANLLVARVAHTGGTAGTAMLELVTNAYIQAQAVQSETGQDKCMDEWSDEENIYCGEAIAKTSKAKTAKPKHKSKTHKKARAIKH